MVYGREGEGGREEGKKRRREEGRKGGREEGRKGGREEGEEGEKGRRGEGEKGIIFDLAIENNSLFTPASTNQGNVISKMKLELILNDNQYGGNQG